MRIVDYMKLAICILAYDNGPRVVATMKRFFDETDTEGLDLDCYVFVVPYPLPDKITNFQTIRKAAANTPWLITWMTNDGQDANIRKMAAFLDSVGSYDIFVPYDTDVAPRSRAWLQDAVKVFAADKKCGAVTMNCSVTDNALCQQRGVEPVGGVRVAKLMWPGGWPITMMRMSFLLGGYEQWHSYYGGTEGAILKALNERGFTHYMMRDHDDARYMTGQDPEYHQWKVYAISRPTALSFEEWLEEKNKKQEQET
jgi:hypothetical protein